MNTDKIINNKDQENNNNSDEPPIGRGKCYPKINRLKWNNWKWQNANRITSKEELSLYLDLTKEEIERDRYFSITPYYLSLMNLNNINDPIRKMIVPTTYELEVKDYESDDSLHEEESSPCKCLVHRYSNRALFLVTGYCSVTCSFCTRSRIALKQACNQYIKKDWVEAIQYIKDHREINDVIISGGDPLLLPDKSIEWILKELRKIDRDLIIRIGTKVLTVLPMRITNDLCKILKKYAPIYINIHVEHPNELTKEMKESCSKLINSGCILGSQSVLLRDINDNINILKNMFQKLLTFGVKPYYLFAVDLVKGTSHFRTTIDKGLELMYKLRGNISGMAIPAYIVDGVNGKGKVQLLPNSIIEKDEHKVVLKNYKGELFTYNY